MPSKRKRRFRVKLPTWKQWQAMIFGSDRPGHLFAITVTGGALIVAGAFLGPWLSGVGTLAILWEWACTPDVDYAENRSLKKGNPLWQLICLAWLPYGELVRHRSKLSHSLAFGLPCRFAYVVLLLWVLAWCGFTGPYDWAWGEVWGLWEHQSGAEALALFIDRWSMMLIGAALGDTVHLLKDDYNLIEVIWGK
jgi:uncharacterized metal-binding protein